MPFRFGFIGSTIALSAVTAHAAIIYVDRDAPGPVGDGATWCTAFHQVYEAIAMAQAGDVIRVAEGTYSPDTSGLIDPREATFQLAAGVTIEGAYAGCGAANPDARDFIGSETILSGDINGDDGINCCYPHGSPSCADASCQDMVCDDDPFCCESTWDDLCAERASLICVECITTSTLDNSYHVIAGPSSSERGAPAVIDGFTVQRGTADGAAPHDRGGAMVIEGGAVVVSNCRFVENFAGGGALGYGGAVYHSNGSLEFSNCEFSENIAAGEDALGGAIMADGSAPVVNDTRFDTNTVSGVERAGGGAVGTDNGATPAIHNSEFTGHFSSLSGGAIANWNGSKALLSDSQFNDNECQASGGAVANFYQSGSIVIGCIFHGNLARGGSAGAFRDFASNSILIGSEFTNNTTLRSQAGVYIGVEESNPSFSYCTFTNNSSRDSGAVEIRGDVGLIDHCSFVSNTSQQMTGGGLQLLTGA